ncbi:MAG TPA: putative maltokinase, partial [Actinomycetota bacterium]|nr:putative maltokinase [Actinomycetota bacterium]
PHTFYWFSLQPEPAPAINVQGRGTPSLHLLEAQGGISASLLDELRGILPSYLQTRRWYAGKTRRIQSVDIADEIPLARDEVNTSILVINVAFTEGDPHTYLLPISTATGRRAEEIEEQNGQAVIAHVEWGAGHGIVYDSIVDPAFTGGMLTTITRRRRIRGRKGEIVAFPTPSLRTSREPPADKLTSMVLGADQSNTSVVFGDEYIMKLFRRIEEGMNPDLELSRFLTESRDIAHVPRVRGWIEYRDGGAPAVAGILQQFIPNEGDAWSYTIDQIDAYVDQVLTRPDIPDDDPDLHVLDAAAMEPPELALETIGAYLEHARLLGQRTGELHVALASEPDDPDFKPEPFTPFYQRSLYQSMRALSRSVFASLKTADADDAPVVLEWEDEIVRRFGTLLTRPIEAMRIRTHGDYHLGQVLFTGKDFVIIDFEGEPSRPLGARRIKRSALSDVAGMIRSLHYAASSVLLRAPERVPQDLAPAMEQWLHFWYRWVSATFLRCYLSVTAGSGLLPPSAEDLRTLLDVFLLEKAVYEAGYEANNRPTWLRIPLEGLRHILHEGAE